MPQKINNLIGQKFNRLIVIKLASQDWNGCTSWLCKCDCGEEIIVRGNNLQRECTKSCGCLRKETASKTFIELNKIQVGINHPNYVNGKYCRKRLKEIEDLKGKIRKRDNYTCQDCGMTQEECKKKYNRILDVHHIDGDDTNNVEENMISLCYKCHRKTKKCR